MSIETTNGGIYLGQGIVENDWVSSKSRLFEVWKKSGRLNIYNGPRHLLFIGPNGSGKTRRVIVPNLYRLVNYSTVVIDPKGELALMTAKHRADNGSVVITFDPFGVIESGHPGIEKELPYLKSQGFNPIAMLDPKSDDFPDEAKAISEALIKVEGRDTHWVRSAQALVTGLIMALRMTLDRDDPNNSIAEVRRLLSMSPEVLGAYIQGVIRDTQSEPTIAPYVRLVVASKF